MNETRDSALELKVGFFILTGLAVIGAMVIYFGGLGEAFRKSYRITVELPDASGLLMDSSVMLAGARVGKVATYPEIILQPKLLQAGSGVEVTLQIDQWIRIPEGSEFHVGSSGLLGDRFMAVRPPADFDGKNFIAPGARLAGSSVTSIEDIQRQGAQLIEELREVVGKVNGSVGKVQTEFLGDEALGDLKQVFTNIKNTSEAFAQVSSKITGLVDGAGDALQKASSAIESLSGTMAKGEQTLENANKASEDIRTALADARRLIGSAQGVVDRAGQGRGLVSALLNDRRLAADVGALAANLRSHGLLFYRDTAAQQTSGGPGRTGPEGAPTPARAGRPGSPH